MTVEKSAAGGGTFIGVFAAVLLDNVLHLDETVGRVMDLVSSSGRPDRELIVTLQSFDRLKQVFEALGEALTRYAEASDSTAPDSKARAQIEQNVISEIMVADLKDRLWRRYHNVAPAIATPQMSALALAEVDVDVVF